MTYLWVALGSALGGAARYGCAGLAARWFGASFPWGTLVINVSGSLLIGFLATLMSPDGRLLATLKQGAMFEVFDLASGRSVAQLRNSTTVAHGVAVSPDSRYAFVSSEGVGAAPGKVDVYDLRALAKAGTVDVGQQASGIAFWKMGAPR